MILTADPLSLQGGLHPQTRRRGGSYGNCENNAWIYVIENLQHD